MAYHSLSLFLLVAVMLAFSSVQCSGEQREGGRNELVFLGSAVNAVPGKLRGATVSQASLYFHSTNNAGFAAARTDCQNILGPDATLLIIETQEELAAVTKYLQSSDETASSFWVGAGYDTSVGAFMWENGVAVGPWAKWAPGHPNSRTSITKLAISGVGSSQFEARFQTQTNRYLCELHY